MNEQIVHGAAQGIVVCDSELKYKLFNPFMEKLTGKRAEDVIGKCAVEVFPELRTAGLETLLRRALDGEVVQADDVLLPRHSATGHDVWESCTYAPHRDAQGHAVGAIALVRDVTERHVAEEMFRSIVVGTASATGANFFPSLVRHMAIALRARYAFIAQCTGEKRSHALAFWRDGEFAPNFELQVAGTPCERVMQGETCYLREDLQ
jgi:PAS domain S-box-containing protein